MMPCVNGAGNQESTALLVVRELEIACAVEGFWVLVTAPLSCMPGADERSIRR